MRNLARYENGLTGPHAKSLVTKLKMKLASNDVDPLILIVMEMAQPAASAAEFENAHCTIGVPCGDLAIVGFAAELDLLVESVFSCGDRDNPALAYAITSFVRAANSHVKWATPEPKKVLLLFLLASIPLPAQNNPRDLVLRMVQNELASQRKPRYWMYLDSKEKPGRTEVDRVIQTPECWLSWPVSVDRNAPTATEISKARDHMESLVNDPRLRRKNRDEIDADSRKSAELLKILPEAFLFTEDGRQGNFVQLKFRPNPKYRPPSSESKVFHHMEGTLLIDAKEIRLAKLSGKLVSDVEFGFGILGKLQKGGTFEVVQSEVAPNDWEVSLLDVHITGRALFFHTIGEQQHEVKSQFEPVRPDLGVTEASAKIARDSSQTLARSPSSR